MLPSSTKVLDDLEVLHVLTGRIAGMAGGDQPALRIDHIGRKTGAADFFKTAYQELQIDNRTNHAQEAAGIHDRAAHQTTVRASLPLPTTRDCPL